MVIFTEDAFSKQDHFFVKEDPARIYRGLKDLLVEEFDMDRIEEAKSEFNVTKPKDKIRLHAFKEKSYHTAIHYSLQFRSKRPKKIYRMEHGEDILKARVGTAAKVKTHYPGGEEIEFLPQGLREDPRRTYDSAALGAEEKSPFQRSALYKKLVGLWYNKFYSKEIHRYEEEASEVCLRIHDLMREKFGVEKAIGRTGAEHYKPPWQ